MHNVDVVNQFITFSARLIGKKHLMSGGCCQDYTAQLVDESTIYLAHADGVGGCPNSEVGASIATQIAVQCLQKCNRIFMSGTKTPEQDAHRVLIHTVSEIANRIADIANPLMNIYRDPQALKDYMLKIRMIKLWFQFTMNLAVIGPKYTYVGGVGDGVHMVNNETTYLDQAFINTEGLVGPKTLVDGMLGNLVIPELTFVKNTEDVTDVMIGGDGIIKFNETRDLVLDKNLSESPQGDIYQFRDEKYVKNSMAAQRRMNLIGMRNGLWPEDDVAFIWARRI